MAEQTALLRFSDKETAITHGQKTAAQMKRPFKLRGVAV